MPNITIGEILELVKEQEGLRGNLLNRWEGDYALWRLEQTDPPEAGFVRYESNEARTAPDKVISSLANGVLSIRIPIPVEASDAEKEKISKSERFLYGVLGDIDRQNAKVMEPSLLQAISWDVNIRGYWAACPRIYKDLKNEEPIIECPRYDSLNTYWEVSPKSGLIWLIHKREATKKAIKRDFKKEIEAKTTTVYDYWDEDVNAICTAEKWLKRPLKHNFGKNPCKIGRVGLQPTVGGKYSDNIEDLGESFYGSTRNLFALQTEALSYIYQEMTNLINAPIVYTRGPNDEGGEPIIEIVEGPRGKDTASHKDLFKEKTAIEIPYGSKLERLLPTPMTQESMYVISFVNSQIQRGGVNWGMYGETPFELSGLAFHMLQQGGMTVLLPRQQTIEMAFTAICEELLRQFSESGIEEVSFTVPDASRRGYEMEEFKPSDVGPYRVIVQLSPRTPDDEMTRIAMSKTAMDAGLLSKETALDTMMKVQDPRGEMKKILWDKLQELPPVALWNGYKAAKEAKDEELASIIGAALLKTMPELVALLPGVVPSQGGPMPAQPQQPPGGMMPPVPGQGGGIPEGAPPGMPPPEVLAAMMQRGGM